jgi:ArsR family transcriptional regulator, arsenate/arsenite/antimonite-responsive transcriptional repressor
MRNALPSPLQEFLKALASDTRQNILLLFMDGQERTVNQIAAALQLGQSTASEHLSQMRRAGLLVSTKAGKEVLYRPDREAILRSMGELQALLTRCC